MNRPWEAADLVVARRLAGQGAPHQMVAMCLDRPTKDIDLALWTLFGRSPERAAAKLNGEPVLDETWGEPELDILQVRILAWLSVDSAEAGVLAGHLNVELAAVEEALRRLAEDNLVDAYEGPPPHDRRHFRWFAVRRPQ